MRSLATLTDRWGMRCVTRDESKLNAHKGARGKCCMKNVSRVNAAARDPINSTQSLQRPSKLQLKPTRSATVQTSSYAATSCKGASFSADSHLSDANVICHLRHVHFFHDVLDGILLVHLLSLCRQHVRNRPSLMCFLFFLPRAISGSSATMLDYTVVQ